MFGLSGEHIVILLIILLFLGPRKLPEVGNSMGKALKNFKDAISGVQDATYRNLGDKKDPPVAATETKVAPEPAIAKKKDPADDSSPT